MGIVLLFFNYLRSVTIGGSVTSIGKNAFRYNLITSLIIPNSVTTIGDGAFYQNEIPSLIIPNSVTSIGNWAFMRNQLTSVTIPNSVTSIGRNAFNTNDLTSVTIPNSVTFTGANAFSNNQLTSVIISNSVTKIGSWAFQYNLLTAVSIPNSVDSIGQSAFADNKLTSVTIPNSVTYIGRYAFMRNTLTDFTLPHHNQGYIHSWSGGVNTYQSGDVVSDFGVVYTIGEMLTAVDFNIVYNLDGGYLPENPITYTIETPTITLNEAAKHGFAFEGWYSESDFVNQVTIITNGSMGDLVLFAKFGEVGTGVIKTEKNIFSFYPNPSTDFVHSDLELSNLTISNPQGTVVSQFNSKSTKYNVSNLEAGVYVIEAIGTDGVIYTSKLIKD